jgi:hypothetical protein
MALQAKVWTEMRVSVNIKQELPGRVITHELHRLSIKESLENTEILRFHRSFAAVNGTLGRIMDYNGSQCLYQTDIAGTCQFLCHKSQYCANFSFTMIFLRRPGPLIWPRTSGASIIKRSKAVFNLHYN